MQVTFVNQISTVLFLVYFSNLPFKNDRWDFIKASHFKGVSLPIPTLKYVFNTLGMVVKDNNVRKINTSISTNVQPETIPD